MSRLLPRQLRLHIDSLCVVLFLQGIQRVQAEFKHVAAGVGSQFPFLQDLTVVNDNMNQWRMHLKDFDDDLPGGRQLNQDLQQLQQQ
jgi:Fe-S-cluster formation regulator IscX/YfhJ